MVQLQQHGQAIRQGVMLVRTQQAAGIVAWVTLYGGMEAQSEQADQLRMQQLEEQAQRAGRLPCSADSYKVHRASFQEDHPLLACPACC